MQQCPTKSLPQPSPNTSQLETLAAFTVEPNNVAKIRVEYKTISSNSANVVLNSTVYFQNNMSKAPVDVIRIVAQPNSLTAPPFPTQSGQTSIAYAVYALNVSSNASVFYVLAITGMCPEIRLQLGQEFSFLDLTSFLLTP